MRVPRIYHPASISLQTETELSPDAFQHLIKVLRLNVGDSIVLFNGDGQNYEAKITSVQKNQHSLLQPAVRLTHLSHRSMFI